MHRDDATWAVERYAERARKAGQPVSMSQIIGANGQLLADKMGVCPECKQPWPTAFICAVDEDKEDSVPECPECRGKKARGW